MILENRFDNTPDNDSSIDSPHLDTYQKKAPQPKLLKEVRDEELRKSKLDDSNYLLSLESDMHLSSENKFPFNNTQELAREKEDLKENVRKSIKNLQIKYPFDNFEDIVLEKNARKGFDQKVTDSNKKNIKVKIQLDKKQEMKKKQNFFLVLSTLLVVKDFFRKLRNLSSLRTPNKLEKAQINLIGDKTYIKEENSNLILTYFYKFDERILILDPSKNFSILVDFIVLLALSYFFLMIPLHFTYESFASYALKIKFDEITIFVLAFDILRVFNTAFFLKGKLEYSRWKIAIQYLKQDFWFDFLSLTPTFTFLVNTSQNNFKYSIILFYYKIKNFKRIISRLEQLLLTNKKFNHAISLIKLISWIILITHSFACIWNGIGLVGNEHFGKSWLKEKGLDHANSLDQYLFSYYFVCVTMNTVGFGDIVPTNKLEVCFCIVFIFFACGIFAYSINSIGLILTDISKQQDEYRKDLNTINDFMRKKNISFDLRMRIRKYLEYIKKENKIHEDEKTGKTIEKLSDSLREELLLEANGSILKSIKFFSWYFSEETLRKTMMIMKEKRFTPGDIIFEKGDFQENKLYIIKTGEVELLFGNSSHLKTVHTCKKGETLGQWSFFSGQEQKFSARSVDFTTTFAIDKNEFLSIINKVNKDFEKFNEIKEKLILYNDPSPLQARCICCHGDNHKLEGCPLIHFCPKNQIVIGKFLFNYFQERGDYKRKRKKNNSFVNRSKNSKRARLLQENILKISSFEFEDESEEEDGKNTLLEFGNSITVFAENKIQTIESFENQSKKADDYSHRSRIVARIKELIREESSHSDCQKEKSSFKSNYKELIREESSHYDAEKEKYAYKFNLLNNEEKVNYNKLNLSNSVTMKEPTKLYDMMNFDKLGYFSNYFPKNDVEFVLKNIELIRINYLKRMYSKRANSNLSLSPRSPHFSNIHNINEAFFQGGSIKINQKAMINFHEDQKRKGILRTVTKQLNLKKNFFKRIEESPEEIKKYFRAKLRKSENSLKKKFKITLKKIKMCLKKLLI